MRLLFLCHRMPYPLHKGEKIRAWNILKHLARRHEVSLACLADEDVDATSVAELRRHAREVLIERIHPRLRLAFALPALGSARPITVSYFYSRTLQRRIDALIDQGSVDGLLCSSSPMAAYVFRSQHSERLSRFPHVMDLIDVDSEKWRHYAQISSIWSAWLYRREARCLAAFEQRIAREFDRVLVVSEQERRCFPAESAANQIQVMPNGVDLEFFSPKYVPPADSPAISGTAPALVFTGVMSYRPNIDGVAWFAERVLPRVRASIPEVRFYVVGRCPTSSILQLGRRASIIVTGEVADVRPYLAAATVCIVPLRIARGLQNKVLEAMAMGRAVVTTSAALEGIEATPGRDLLVADDEAGFAGAVIELVQNAGRRSEIGCRARACVERHYAWSANLRLLDELFPPTTAATEMRLQANQRTTSDSGASLAPALPPPA